MTYIKHIKKISNNLENSIFKILLNNGITSILNNSHGIDLTIENHIFVEIKSCKKFIRHKNTNKINIRKGYFSFKKNEFKQNIDYYIFILKVNSIQFLDLIKKLDIFVIDKQQIVKMIKKKQKLTHNRTCQTYSKLKKLNYISLNKFIEKIKRVD
jgi:hypothetical protein